MTTTRAQVKSGLVIANMASSKIKIPTATTVLNVQTSSAAGSVRAPLLKHVRKKKSNMNSVTVDSTKTQNTAWLVSMVVVYVLVEELLSTGAVHNVTIRTICKMATVENARKKYLIAFIVAMVMVNLARNVLMG